MSEKYLYLRNGVFYFRMRIPGKCVKRFGMEDSHNWFIGEQKLKGVINNSNFKIKSIENEDLKNIKFPTGKECGFIFFTSPAKDALEYIKNRPHVILNNVSRTFLPMNAVNLDLISSSFNAVTYLASQCGHEKIAILWGGTNSNAYKLAGYRLALDLFGLKFEKDLVFAEAGGKEAGKRAAARIINKLGRFTAIYVDSDLKAFGLLEELNERNVNVPGDISVIGSDDISGLSEKCGLTTIYMPYYEMGKKAAEMMETLISRRNPYINSEIFHGMLVERHTCTHLK